MEDQPYTSIPPNIQPTEVYHLTTSNLSSTEAILNGEVLKLRGSKTYRRPTSLSHPNIPPYVRSRRYGRLNISLIPPPNAGRCTTSRPATSAPPRPFSTAKSSSCKARTLRPSSLPSTEGLRRRIARMRRVWEEACRLCRSRPRPFRLWCCPRRWRPRAWSKECVGGMGMLSVGQTTGGDSVSCRGRAHCKTQAVCARINCFVCALSWGKWERGGRRCHLLCLHQLHRVGAGVGTGA